MNTTKLKLIFILSVAGSLFAATVTARQFLAPTGQPGILSCVGLSIFGLTPCPYGLTLFLLLTIFSGLILYRRLKLWLSLKLISLVGVLFSGWVVWREICLPAIQLGPVFWEQFAVSRIPACAWGFLVFLAIFILLLSTKPNLPSSSKV
jgi:hypothetical protein